MQPIDILDSIRYVSKRAIATNLCARLAHFLPWIHTISTSREASLIEPEPVRCLRWLWLWFHPGKLTRCKRPWFRRIWRPTSSRRDNKQPTMSSLGTLGELDILRMLHLRAAWFQRRDFRNAGIFDASNSVSWTRSSANQPQNLSYTQVKNARTPLHVAKALSMRPFSSQVCTN